MDAVMTANQPMPQQSADRRTDRRSGDDLGLIKEQRIENCPG